MDEKETGDGTGKAAGSTGSQIGMLPVMAQQKEQSTVRAEGFVRNWMAPVGDPARTRFKVSAHSL